ncbi:MAG: hypothetical protein RLZZ450_2663 [Pseudomonadota bacterium]|jgi:hypothetical protein
MPFENALPYWAYAIDSRCFYEQNVTVCLFERCTSRALEKLLNDPDERADLLRFLRDNPHGRSYPHVRALREQGRFGES